MLRKWGRSSPCSTSYKESFDANVVYGTPFQFEWAALQDEYDGKRIRHPRPYDMVIIDEVDSMLIDRSSHSTKVICQAGIFHRVVWIYRELLRMSRDLCPVEINAHNINMTEQVQEEKATQLINRIRKTATVI
eukprot:gb/GECH01000554.1/.p1 GENE.gb/GECH01000554.1/~~gb/GECH01000554.1/.p1  ORF type:complete len:133 (+),score=25.18 gb/GECH01000554.1/:1-399(+)